MSVQLIWHSFQEWGETPPTQPQTEPFSVPFPEFFTKKQRPLPLIPLTTETHLPDWFCSSPRGEDLQVSWGWVTSLTPRVTFCAQATSTQQEESKEGGCQTHFKTATWVHVAPYPEWCPPSRHLSISCPGTLSPACGL